MGKSQSFDFEHDYSLEKIVVEIMNFLENEKKMISEVVPQVNGYFIQTKSKDTWKSLIGMSLATHILFERTDNRLTVTIDNGKWIDKIAAAGVGFLTPIGALTIATSAFGAFNQQKLPDEIFKQISKYTTLGVRDDSASDFQRIFSAVAADDIYNLAIKTQEENSKKSMILFQIAADKKSAKAAVMLGNFYYNGEIVPKDLKKAFEYWKCNVEYLDSDTALKLADMYRDGDIAEKDLKKAYPIYLKASAKEAEQRIMAIFDQGVNLPEYTEYAVKYYVKQYENGQDDYLPQIISLYEKLHDSKNIQKYQIIAAESGDSDLALEYGKKLFETNKAMSYKLLSSLNDVYDPEVSFMLAQMLENGDGTAKDIKSAKKYYQVALNNGYEAAIEKLAKIYSDSTDKDDLNKAFNLYQKSAENKNIDSEYHVAKMLLAGIGTEKNAKKAVQMLKNLIDSGYNDALLDIAIACHDGNGCEQNLDSAINFAQKAVKLKVKNAVTVLNKFQREKNDKIKAEKQAILNTAIAMCADDPSGETDLRVADMYDDGEFIERSPEKMLEYYQSAAAKGNAKAIYKLGQIAENGSDDFDTEPDIAQALELYELAVQLGNKEADKSQKSIKKNIKNIETRISDYILKDDSDDIETILDDIAFEYIEYELPYSYFCGLRYFNVMQERYPDKNFADTFVDSENIKELILGFLYADSSQNDEMCWYYAIKLLEKDVFWVLMGFCDADPLIVPAMKNHGCIEAAARIERIWKKCGKKEDQEKFNKIFEKARKINVEWLIERSEECVFPFSLGNISENTSEESDQNAEEDIYDLYSLHDLTKACDSNDPAVRSWGEQRYQRLQLSLKAIKENNVAVIDKWATLLENTIEQKYKVNKYNPYIATQQMAEGTGMTTGGDHVIFLYCNLVWRCHALGYMRRFKNILNETNTTDIDFAQVQIENFRKHPIEADWLAAQLLTMLLDDRIITDDFVKKL